MQWIPICTVWFKKGFKVAIAEQMEDPKQAKGLVKREVIRVVTLAPLPAPVGSG